MNILTIGVTDATVELQDGPPGCFGHLSPDGKMTLVRLLLLSGADKSRTSYATSAREEFICNQVSGGWWVGECGCGGKEWWVKAILNWAEHSVREQLCLLEMFKLAVRFLIEVFDLGEQLCSRPVGRRPDVRNVPSAGYGNMLLIG